MDEDNRTALVEVSDLAVCFGGEVDALRGVSFALRRGETLAVVGESGSGKSTLALCLAGLVQPPEARGSVRIDGVELLGAPAETLRSVRWSTVAIALQGSPFNPVVTVGDQVAEPLRERRRMGAREARARADALAARRPARPRAARPVPPRAVGRGTAAGRHRHGPGPRPGPRRARRADGRPRPGHPSPAGRAPGRAGGRQGLRPDRGLPRPARCRRPGHPHDGPLRRRGDGGGRHRPGHPRARTSLYVGPRQYLSGHEHHQGSAADPRSASRPPRRPPGLPVQPPLHPGRGHLQREAPRSRAVAGTARALPLRRPQNPAGGRRAGQVVRPWPASGGGARRGVHHRPGG